MNKFPDFEYIDKGIFKDSLKVTFRAGMPVVSRRSRNVQRYVFK